LTKRAAVLAAINHNQFFKKGIHKYETQNERESRRHKWDCSYWRLKPSNQHILSKKGNTAMKIKTKVKAGIATMQHNQTVARGLKVKSRMKAGQSTPQHHQTVARALKVKSGVKAGQNAPPIVRD
jgi:hypothetical protein